MKTTNRKILILVFSLSLISLFSFKIKEDPIELLIKKLNEYIKKYPQEKIHLHLDKPYYAIGDDIWFKAYVVDSRTTAPTTLSQLVYVELIDDKNVIKKQLKLPLQTGVSWGDFKLTDTLSEGNYRIRAYTQLMRNLGTDFFFDKTIKIGNSWANKVFVDAKFTFSKKDDTEKTEATLVFTDKEGKPYANKKVNYEVQYGNQKISKNNSTTNNLGEVIFEFKNPKIIANEMGRIIAKIEISKTENIEKQIVIKALSNKIDVQFFAEGGNFIQGLPNRLGIKAINSNGLGENIQGVILDDEGQEVTNFNTTYLGMGSLYLTPEAGKSYFAKITFADKSEQKVSLPKVQSNGCILTINNLDSLNLKLKVLLTPSILNTGELKIIGQNNDLVYFNAKINTAKQINVINIPKKDLPTGIVQFTLFSTDNLPISERLVFIENTADEINFEIENLKNTYKKREAVDISISTKIDSKPILGSYSVSVTNSNIINPDPESETNILTSLLLTSNLVGYIEKPNHYFLNPNINTRTELDNLMLTQGWRKLFWKNIIDNVEPNTTYQPEVDSRITGTITKGNKPVVNGKITLMSNTGGMFLIDTLSNEKGKFIFDKLMFGDSTKFIIQARTAKSKKDVQIDLDTIARQDVTKNSNVGDIVVNINQQMAPYLQKSDTYFDNQTKQGLLQRTILLDEVKLVAKRKDITKNSSNLGGAGNADDIIDGEKMSIANSVASFLQGRIAGVTIRQGLAYSSRTQSISSIPPMGIIMDGMQMGEGFTLDDINPQDVEAVEVLKSGSRTALYGSYGAAGIILFTTKRGTSGSYNRYTPGLITYYPKGISAVRNFYSPKYDVNIDNQKADLRSTVYWEPQFVSDSLGKAKLNYFNTDQTGLHRVVIEGIDDEGHLARKVFTYQVD
ncbi:MAG: TonB-dependent receptor plug domain-containing protein [Sphingobacteriaceae bacterium]|nr:TonB-dependent receptor plug domain-containing protein [Sphingobacteriaceae bacterium]